MTLGCFQLFAATSNTLMNFKIEYIYIQIYIYIYFYTFENISKEYISGSRLTGIRVMHMNKLLMDTDKLPTKCYIDLYSESIKISLCQVIEKSTQNGKRKLY